MAGFVAKHVVLYVEAMETAGFSGWVVGVPEEGAPLALLSLVCRVEVALFAADVALHALLLAVDCHGGGAGGAGESSGRRLDSSDTLVGDGVFDEVNGTPAARRLDTISSAGLAVVGVLFTGPAARRTVGRADSPGEEESGGALEALSSLAVSVATQAVVGAADAGDAVESRRTEGGVPVKAFFAHGHAQVKVQIAESAALYALLALACGGVDGHVHARLHAGVLRRRCGCGRHALASR